MMTNKRIMSAVSCAIALVGTIIINILANTLPIGNFNTGQISAMYPTLITPPGITFGIWGVIYAMLIVFVVMQFFRGTAEDYGTFSSYFILSCLFNTVWIFAWHSQMIVLATLAIAALFVVLIKLYTLTRESTFVARTTFSIYYAWITIATMIALFVLVKTLAGGAPITPIEGRTYGFSDAYSGIILYSGEPEIVSYVTNLEYVFATLAVIAVAAITIWHFTKFHDYFYVLTIGWAVGGIMVRQLTSVTPPTYMLIAAVLAISAILYVVLKYFIDNISRKNLRYAKARKDENYE